MNKDLESRLILAELGQPTVITLDEFLESHGKINEVTLAFLHPKVFIYLSHQVENLKVTLDNGRYSINLKKRHRSHCDYRSKSFDRGTDTYDDIKHEVEQIGKEWERVVVLLE